MKPHVVMLMETSLDGRLHPSRWSESPDGTRRDWSAAYEATHDALAGDAWIVGRVTMAEMTTAAAHPPASPGRPPRPVHVAPGAAPPFAVALDPSGKLHFSGAAVNGDSALVLLGADVSDGHLAELVADGVSYVVAEGRPIDLAGMVDVLGGAFGVRRLLLEGGAGINGSFLAAGLVDEVHLLVAPAFDGAPGVQGIVEQAGGLAGKLNLSLQAAAMQEHGLVHLHYRVVRNV